MELILHYRSTIMYLEVVVLVWLPPLFLGMDALLETFFQIHAANLIKLC